MPGTRVLAVCERQEALITHNFSVPVVGAAEYAPTLPSVLLRHAVLVGVYRKSACNVEQGVVRIGERAVVDRGVVTFRLLVREAE